MTNILRIVYRDEGKTRAPAAITGSRVVESTIGITNFWPPRVNRTFQETPWRPKTQNIAAELCSDTLLSPPISTSTPVLQSSSQGEINDYCTMRVRDIYDIAGAIK
jgi:hypothetical protein